MVNMNELMKRILEEGAEQKVSLVIYVYCNFIDEKIITQYKNQGIYIEKVVLE